ncbi:MAG: OadG family protein [Lentisphaeria bacterium]|nr:OadG family protein [Lentisphaeria bacterium]
MNSAIADGFKLMLLGMGMVFLFLLAMIMFIKITAVILKLIQSRLPEPVSSTPAVQVPVSKNLVQDQALVKVLSQAITTYKADKLK